MTRIPVIVIGYNIPGTGLTRVMHSLLRHLQDRYDFHYLGIGYQGPFVDDGIKFYPTNLRGGDVFAAFQAAELLPQINASIVFILHDLWVFEQYFRALEPFRGRCQVVAYLPLDGRILDERDLTPLAKAHRVVVYTKFAQKECHAAFDRLRQRHVIADFPPVEVIPHAVDTNSFFPAPSLRAAGFDDVGRTNAKSTVFPHLGEPQNSFVVLNASRPAERKRVDLTIRGFAQFARDKPGNVKLCLHHGIMGEAERRQTLKWVEESELGSRLELNPLISGNGPITDDQLNLLYNACDVGINTSMGEGWGLVSFEHAAAGAAQIVPGHSACAELWADVGVQLPPVARYVPPFSTLEMAEVASEDVANALDRLYCNRELLRKTALACNRNASAPLCTWQKVAGEFSRLFSNLALAPDRERVREKCEVPAICNA